MTSLILHQLLENVKEPSSIVVADEWCDSIPRSRMYSFTNRILGLVLLNLEGPEEKAYRSHSLAGLAHLSNASKTARLYKIYVILVQVGLQCISNMTIQVMKEWIITCLVRGRKANIIILISLPAKQHALPHKFLSSHAIRAN